MPNYKEMYYALAAQVANAIDLLVKAQQQGELSAMEEPAFQLLQVCEKIQNQPKDECNQRL